jgi:hypothetical protein
VADAAGQRADRQRQRDQAERHVDQEDQTPTGVPEVGVDERTGQHRRAEHGQSCRRTEQAGGPTELLIVEDLFQQTETLGDHECAQSSLQRPEGDQHVDGLRRSAGG